MAHFVIDPRLERTGSRGRLPDARRLWITAWLSHAEALRMRAHADAQPVLPDLEMSAVSKDWFNHEAYKEELPTSWKKVPKHKAAVILVCRKTLFLALTGQYHTSWKKYHFHSKVTRSADGVNVDVWQYEHCTGVEFIIVQKIANLVMNIHVEEGKLVARSPSGAEKWKEPDDFARIAVKGKDIKDSIQDKLQDNKLVTINSKITLVDGTNIINPNRIVRKAPRAKAAAQQFERRVARRPRPHADMGVGISYSGHNRLYIQRSQPLIHTAVTTAHTYSGKEQKSLYMWANMGPGTHAP